MRAIQTRYIGPSNTKGARVAAFDEAGNRAVIAYDDSLNQGKAHRKAALALCSKMGWSMDIIGGGIRDGYAFVFRDSDV